MNWIEIERADSYVEACDKISNYVVGKNATPQSHSEFLHGRDLGTKEWSIKDKCLVNLRDNRFYDLLKRSRQNLRCSL